MLAPFTTFQVCAHRGASGTHPENTLAAFAEAVRLGVERVEFDVRRTRDGQLVICHDAKVDRTTDGTGSIWELTLAEIKALDAGSHRDARFAGERVPTFAEALAACPMVCNVHVYPGPDDLEAIVDETVAELLVQDRLASAFIAGDTAVVERVALVEPRLDRCWLSSQRDERYPEGSHERGCRILQPWYTHHSADLVRRAHALGQQVHPFFADDEENMRKFIATGIDGLLTNQPALLQAVLAAG